MKISKLQSTCLITVDLADLPDLTILNFEKSLLQIKG